MDLLYHIPPGLLWSVRIFHLSPVHALRFLSRCKFNNLTTRQPMVEFYLLMTPRFPKRFVIFPADRGECSEGLDTFRFFFKHKSYFGKNRTHDFRTSRCADYLLDHSGDERYVRWKNTFSYQNLVKSHTTHEFRMRAAGCCCSFFYSGGAALEFIRGLLRRLRTQITEAPNSARRAKQRFTVVLPRFNFSIK